MQNMLKALSSVRLNCMKDCVQDLSNFNLRALASSLHELHVRREDRPRFYAKKLDDPEIGTGTLQKIIAEIAGSTSLRVLALTDKTQFIDTSEYAFVLS